MTKWNMPIVSRLNQNFNVNMQILTWILDVYYMILFSMAVGSGPAGPVLAGPIIFKVSNDRRIKF